jgi:diaminobutyrate-2-oxoglutarate transaminase
MQLNLSLSSLGRGFLVLWAGMAVSLVGPLLTVFALSLALFQDTKSVMAFSGMVAAQALPSLFILPWAGSLADNAKKRRYVLIGSGCAKLMLSLVLALLLWKDALETWHFYAFNIVIAINLAFEVPTLKTAISSVLTKDQMTRGSGLIVLTTNLVQVLAPMAASVLIGYIGLPGIVMIEIVSCCLALVLLTVATSYMPSGAPSIQTEKRFSSRSVMNKFMESLTFFKERRLLIALLLYAMMLHSLMDLVSLLITPLVLSNHTSSDLSVILTIGLTGSLIGSGLLSVTENPGRLMVIILSCNVILSISVLVAGGGGNSVALYSVCAFIAMMAGAVGDGCNQAFWMRKVPLEHQGSIFALLGAILLIAQPVVAVSGGFLADKVFGPALVEGGVWANSVGLWLGTGKGRGLSLVFVICGALCAMLSLTALMHGRLRNIDIHVPDGR